MYKMKVREGKKIMFLFAIERKVGSTCFRLVMQTGRQTGCIVGRTGSVSI